MSKFHRMLSLASLGLGMITALSLSPAAHAASKVANPCPQFVADFAKDMKDQYKVLWVVTPKDLSKGGETELTFVKASKKSPTKPLVDADDFYAWQKSLVVPPQIKVPDKLLPDFVNYLDKNLRAYGGVLIVTYPDGGVQGNLFVPVFANGKAVCYPSGAVDLSEDDIPPTQ